MLITITAVLIFRDIDVTFLTSIKAVNQKSTGLAVSRDQFFITKMFKKNIYVILYDSGTYAVCVAYGRWGGVTFGSR